MFWGVLKHEKCEFYCFLHRNIEKSILVSRLFARPERGQFEDSLEKKGVFGNREFYGF